MSATAERRAEARSPGWADAHPYVAAEFDCERCGLDVEWTAEDLYEEFGTISLSVDQARQLEHECSWCRGAGERHRVQLVALVLWAPGAGDEEDPLLDWSAEG